MMGDMGSMADIRIQSMQHNDNSFWLADTLMPVGTQFDGFLVLGDLELDPIQLVELTLTLWIGTSVFLVLLGFFNQFLLLFFCQGPVFRVIIEFEHRFLLSDFVTNFLWL